MLERQDWDVLRGSLLNTGPEPDAVLAQLRTFSRMLLEWNRSASNLVSRNDESRFVERHLVESVAPARWLSESGCTSWLDLGSGGGLPAIPLAIAGVGARWTLVESRRTKTLFMRKAIQEMVLGGFEVVNERLENLLDDPRLAQGFDGFTSRATMRLGPTLALAARFIRPGGSAFLWKGSGREEEMEKDPSWRESWEFTGIMGVGGGPTVVARFIRLQAK